MRAERIGLALILAGQATASQVIKPHLEFHMCMDTVEPEMNVCDPEDLPLHGQPIILTMHDGHTEVLWTDQDGKTSIDGLRIHNGWGSPGESDIEYIGTTLNDLDSLNACQKDIRWETRGNLLRFDITYTPNGKCAPKTNLI